MKSPTFYLMIVIVGVFALWQVPAMIWGYQVSMESTRQLQGEESRMADLIGGPAPVRWFRGRKEYGAYFSRDELTKRRYVSYEATVPFEALLAEGEATPDPQLHALYATARAPEWAMQFCPELLRDFTRACGFQFANARVRRNGEVALSGRLSVIPTYDMGDPSGVKNGAFFSASHYLRPVEDVLNTAENRIKVFDEAVALCAEMRAIYGNCVINAVRFKERRTSLDPESPIQLEASVTLAVYADKSVHNSRSVRDQLKQVANGLMN